jgi:L-serine dehydratase
MNVFDIIGPVMVGPSSSHTAGAARIGKVVRTLLGEEPVKAFIIFHGSFARTYRGHGTDRAVIGGLLGFETDDLRIRDSLNLAREAGLEYIIETGDLGEVHPNTVLIKVEGKSGKTITVVASSIGGGNIVVREIDGLQVDFTGESHTIIISHRDAPGAVASVTSLLAVYKINIGQMKVYRTRRGGDAIMVIETDQEPAGEVADKLEKLECVQKVTLLRPV